MNYGIAAAVGATALLGAAMMLGAGWDRPPVEVTQLGYRGLGMEQVTNPRDAARTEAARVQPSEGIPPGPPEGPLARDVYQNVQVLGDLPEADFIRVMAAITEWVSPEQGCNYCHNPENLASDEVYTKVVSRRMIEMTRAVNTDWSDHVGATGVTCFTCHRGQPVPGNIWFEDNGLPEAGGMTASRKGQNTASVTAGYTSLPNDPFSTLFRGDETAIRVVGQTALPDGTPGATIQQTEGSYALMMHMSGALGVNCTFCHNSRSFSSWESSSPLRVTAWHGINMVRGLNREYLEPLGPTYPPHRLGPNGDAPKVACGTCHQGQSKPLGGLNMVESYPELGAQTAQQGGQSPAPAQPAQPAAEPAQPAQPAQ